ncbi:MAG: DUF1565 domain-containing protein [Planctomycetota bacterium]|jgi:alpha-N-arabinofuranosidase
MFCKKLYWLFTLTVIMLNGCGRQYHVSVKGDDLNGGMKEKPLRTISAAAQIARPGDTITVHAGTYREQISPLRGGTSDQQRIIYQAAKGEEVIIKGSEPVKGWQKVQNDTWKVTVDNSLFGDFNPYRNLINGDWFWPMGREHHTGAVYLNNHWLTEAATLDEVLKPIDDTPRSDTRLWYAKVDSANTTIWAQFKDTNPNEEQVEVNVRQAIFYPEQTGINYITLKGFKMMHAATPWAPPTAEQVGLVGTNWSKGWIIEYNNISYSVCTGITLGKYGDKWDNKSYESGTGYTGTIKRALENGWSRENIGSHIVRNNHISHCEQAGIVGSLGAAFSTITGNEIHDIHVRRLFSGAEMAGIKIHGAIDTEISNNYIYRTHRGIWLDWMAQGARVTRNLLHDNDGSQDLFFEVNHGPFMVDHNICLSRFDNKAGAHWFATYSVLDVSQGGTYAHNLFLNGVLFHEELARETPFMKAHSTEIAGIDNIPGGDSRFYNNILVNCGFEKYENAEFPLWMAGNVFLNDAKPLQWEKSALVHNSFDPDIKLLGKPDGKYLQIKLDTSWSTQASRPLVTTELLGKTNMGNLPYVKPDQRPYRLDTDYVGTKRNVANPSAGPFEFNINGKQTLKIWPLTSN